MKHLAVIPARSGSKGFRHKNIRKLNGKPLLAYAIEAAQEARLFDEIMVSTDSEIYAAIAADYGASVPFLRSAELAADDASTWDVARDVIIRYGELGREFDTLALLQPTSPLRRPIDIIEGYKRLFELDANCVVSVCEVDHSPLWSNTLPEDLSMASFLDPTLVNTPRQALGKYYRINGALYIVKIPHLMSSDNIYDQKSYAIVMPREYSVDIDDELDFFVAEAVLRFLGKCGAE